MTPSDLCVACGMCCDGTMFGNVVCSKEEAEYMQSLGLSTKKKEDQENYLFIQPCSMHINGSCSIYDDPKKPKTCSSYKCHLLKRVLRNEITPEQAMKKVERVKKAKQDLGVASVKEARQLKTEEANRFVKDIKDGFYGPKKKT